MQEENERKRRSWWWWEWTATLDSAIREGLSKDGHLNRELMGEGLRPAKCQGRGVQAEGVCTEARGRWGT